MLKASNLTHLWWPNTLHPYVTLWCMCLCAHCGCAKNTASAEISVSSRGFREYNRTENNRENFSGSRAASDSPANGSICKSTFPSDSKSLELTAWLAVVGWWHTAEERLTLVALQKPFRLCSDCARSRFVQIVTRLSWSEDFSYLQDWKAPNLVPSHVLSFSHHHQT